MEVSQRSKERELLSLYIRKNSCANSEIVVVLMEDVSLIEVMWSFLYSRSLPGANNMEYAMKNILNEQIISSNRRQTGW